MKDDETDNICKQSHISCRERSLYPHGVPCSMKWTSLVIDMEVTVPRRKWSCRDIAARIGRSCDKNINTNPLRLSIGSKFISVIHFDDRPFWSKNEWNLEWSGSCIVGCQRPWWNAFEGQERKSSTQAALHFKEKTIEPLIGITYLLLPLNHTRI